MELMKSLISLVGSWASNSSNWLMIASATKSSMLLPRNTILSLSNSPITSPSAPLAAVEGVWGEESSKVRLVGFRNWDPKFVFLEGIGEAGVKTHLGGVLEKREWGLGMKKKEEEMGGLGFEERVRMEEGKG